MAYSFFPSPTFKMIDICIKCYSQNEKTQFQCLGANKTIIYNFLQGSWISWWDIHNANIQFLKAHKESRKKRRRSSRRAIKELRRSRTGYEPFWFCFELAESPLLPLELWEARTLALDSGESPRTLISYCEVVLGSLGFAQNIPLVGPDCQQQPVSNL